MSAEAAAAAAESRLREFATRCPDAVRLARIGSVAVSLDAALLRVLRFELMPGSDAGIEADLWFSPLVESMSSQGFVLNPAVAQRLRAELAADVVNGKQALLERAAQIVESNHRAWPPSLLLEERVIWLSLKKSAGAREQRKRATEIESLLRQAVKAMHASDERGREVARWAQRALRGLPAAALQTEAAFLLALGASERLAGRAVLAGVDQSRRLPDNVEWILPEGHFSNHVQVAFWRRTDGLEFLSTEGSEAGMEPPAGVLLIKLPKTNPLLLQIGWRVGPSRSQQSLTLGRGARFVAIPGEAIDIRLRTLAGDEFGLEDDVGNVVLPPIDLIRAAVGIRRLSANREIRCTGFLISRDHVITAANMLGLADSPSSPAEHYEVDSPGGVVAASLVAVGEHVDVVILRLVQPLTGAEVIPWETDASAHSVGVSWVGGAYLDTAFETVVGTLTSFAVRRSRVPFQGDLIELAYSTASTASEQVLGPGWSGAPVIVNDRLAGMIVAANNDPSNPRVYAVPAEAMRPFVDLSLNPGYERERIFLSYLAMLADGRPTDDARRACNRIRAALQVANFGTVVDDNQTSRARSPVYEDLLESMETWDGAVCVLARPIATTSYRDVGMALLAYRVWTRPNFPVALLYTGGAAEQSALPQALQGLTPTALDPLTDSQLLGQLESRLSSPGSNDEASGRQSLVADLSRLLPTTSVDGPISGVDPRIEAIVAKGVHALAWQDLMNGLDSAERRELAEIAAALSFPWDTLQPLRDALVGDSVNRAYYVEALPAEAAPALIRRAWSGQGRPGSVTLQAADWKGSVAGILDRVCETVSRAVSCTPARARKIVQQSTAPFCIIFATQPVLSASLIEQVLEALPGALLLFPGGGARRSAPSDLLLTLAPLVGATASQFSPAFEAMMEAVRSAPSAATARIRPRQNKASKKMPIRRKSAKKK